MNNRPTAPASLPPPGIAGLNPDWSRLVHVPATDSDGRTWHILDSHGNQSASTEPALTLLCVHGNPSWSFLWRAVIKQVSAAYGHRVRVIAVDQLDMGFSERTGLERTLSIRVSDLCQLTHTLGLRGPVMTVAHDWGGPVSLGWALRHLPKRPTDQTSAAVQRNAVELAGVILTNTAVHQPAGSPAPAVIRLIRLPLLLKTCTVHTKAFIQGAIEMSRPKLGAEVRKGFHAPYLTASRRAAIADFVADIPLNAEHESAASLDAIASGLELMAQIPALLLWGPRDKVFSDLYLHDLEQRLPHADVHRFPGAAHFVGEDADVAGAVVSWLEQHIPDNTEAVRSPQAPLMSGSPTHRRALADFSVADPEADAVVEIAPVYRAMNFKTLAHQVKKLAAGMHTFGIQPGDRVAVMVMPGIDLSLTVYACWRLGATLVLVDSGLGRSGMQRALHSANPDYLIGIDKALIAATLLRWPGKRIAVGSRSTLLSKALGILTDLQTLIGLGEESEAPSFPHPDTLAALAFTSGSTGPSKGVLYRHHQIQAQRDALMNVYDINARDRLVAAFAPFALYGPTMGITSVVPDMDVTAPASLNASALADAVLSINATLVFASPAALVNVVNTASELTDSQRAACHKVRAVISAGAPVRANLLHSATSVFSSAHMHTPYGMTEILPVANISLEELQELSAGQDSTAALGAGVCVGFPMPGTKVMIAPLDEHGNASAALTDKPDVLGEIVVQALHARERYDRLWLTDHRASQPAGWHRTGDVGQLDASGRLWVGGRLGHIITTPAGVLAPVDSEQRIETINEVSMAAVVGVGPVGSQVIVAVVQMPASDQPGCQASMALTDQVRQVTHTSVDIAAVLVATALPVDRRHNSKIDRSAIAVWAAKVLSGERVASL